MKMWLHDGPLDGAEIDVPALVNLVVFTVASSSAAACYRHNGNPEEPDQIAPVIGNHLDYVPEQRHIPVTGN